MTTAMETVFIGKKREFNRRVLECSLPGGADRLHAGGGLGKGRVENQVGNTASSSSPEASVQARPKRS